jgi:uncharacterized protein (UPF0548 family)
MNQRSTHVGESLTYAAVGASQAPDLLYYPPAGFRPAEDRIRLGSGIERFEAATATLMSWGVQRGSGIAVTNVELPSPTDTDYTGLVYDETGKPLAPLHDESEQAYTADGAARVCAGMSADLVIKTFGLEIAAPVRVVLVIEEPNRAGFAYGTLPGHPEQGEESFIVVREPDDSVFFVVRSFSRASTWWYRLGTPLLRFQQRAMTRRYLRALLPGRTQ